MGKIIFLCVAFSMGYVSLNAEKPKVSINPKKALKLLAIISNCSEETGVEGAALRRQLNNKHLTDDLVTKQFFFCTYKKAEVINENGDIIPEKFAEYYPSDVKNKNIQAAVRACQQVTGAPIDKVYNFLKCYQSIAPVEMILEK